MANMVYETGMASVNGCQLSYRLYPKDPAKRRSDLTPVVCIAGWGSTMNEWFFLPSEMSKLGRPVLLFDNRGIGASSEHTGAISAEILASDALALVKQLLPSGSVAVLGHSAGAFAAQHIAIHSPERVKAVIMVCGQGSRKNAKGGAPGYFKLGRSTFHDGNLENRKELLGYMLDSNEVACRAYWTNFDFNDICKRSLMENRPKATIDAQFKMLASSDFGDQLASIRCPVQVIHGEADPIIPASNAQLLFDEVSGAAQRDLAVLPGSHFVFGPNLEAARAVVKSVATFLDVPNSKL